MMSSKSTKSTLNVSEVEKFSKIADKWWDLNGEFAILHEINPCRISYILRQIEENFGKATSAARLENLSLLDVGCGGGLISVPMARLGAKVTSLDASHENIKTLKVYAEKNGIELSAQAALVEDFVKTKSQFDVVLALEIVEHVDNPELFIECLAKLVKPNGILILSTINKNLKSLALAKFGAEYVLNWAPVGTHDWRKFITPDDLSSMVKNSGLSLRDISGMTFSPFKAQKWSVTNDTSVNYFLCAKK